MLLLFQGVVIQVCLVLAPHLLSFLWGQALLQQRCSFLFIRSLLAELSHPMSNFSKLVLFSFAFPKAFDLISSNPFGLAFPKAFGLAFPKALALAFSKALALAFPKAFMAHFITFMGAIPT